MLLDDADDGREQSRAVAFTHALTLYRFDNPGLMNACLSAHL
jgi:hypothetical protein